MIFNVSVGEATYRRGTYRAYHFNKTKIRSRRRVATHCRSRFRLFYGICPRREEGEQKGEEADQERQIEKCKWLKLLDKRSFFTFGRYHHSYNEIVYNLHALDQASWPRYTKLITYHLPLKHMTPRPTICSSYDPRNRIKILSIPPRRLTLHPPSSLFLTRPKNTSQPAVQNMFSDAEDGDDEMGIKSWLPKTGWVLEILFDRSVDGLFTRWLSTEADDFDILISRSSQLMVILWLSSTNSHPHFPMLF